MKDFQYHKATTVQEAFHFLSQYGAEGKIIAGGQSLLILMRQGLVAPEHVIDIKGVKELDYIRFDEKEGLFIGATTTHRSIEKSLLLREKYEVLVQMERKLATIQTRNWGTIGGNLCHADPAGDPAPVLIALGADLKLGKEGGERKVSLEEFSVDYYETVLEEDEMLLEIQVPVPPARTATVYEKFTIIDSDMAIVSVAASITAGDDGGCKGARIVLGGAAPVPMRARKAEEMLVGEKLKDELLEEVGRAAAEESEPISDIHASEEYKRELIRVLTKRMVRRAWERAIQG